MCKMMSHLNAFSLTSRDWMTLNSRAYTSCLWARGGDDADGEWRMSRAVINRALYLRFNQKQWCTIYLSSFPVISGPNDNLGGGEALVTDPGTNYRPFTLTIHHWTLTPDHTLSDLDTRGHRTLSTPPWDSGDTGLRHWHLACKHLTETSEYSLYSDTIYFPWLVLINNQGLTINFLAACVFTNMSAVTLQQTTLNTQETYFLCVQIIQTMNQSRQTCKNYSVQSMIILIDSLLY